MADVSDLDRPIATRDRVALGLITAAGFDAAGFAALRFHVSGAGDTLLFAFGAIVLALAVYRKGWTLIGFVVGVVLVWVPALSWFWSMFDGFRL